jgi:hypothetical protein
MRYLLSCLCLLVFSGIAQADHVAFLTWQGQVSAPVTLEIQGDRVTVEGRRPNAVSGGSFQFNRPLPRAGRDFKVNVLEGNGTVRILEQPSSRNDFALVVRINPRGRSEFHRLEFTAEHDETGSVYDDRRRARTGERSRSRNLASGAVTWSGRVDNEAIVIVQGGRARSTAVRGRSVTSEQADFTSRLPNAPVEVSLVDGQGRGQIELLEQPTSANGYAAKVRIVDQAAAKVPTNLRCSGPVTTPRFRVAAVCSATSGRVTPADR